jgi:hypothetical protein
MLLLRRRSVPERIGGTVVTDEPNPQPLRRVTLTMSLASTSVSAPRITNTDDNGGFAFTGLPAGVYGPPRAMKSGFVPSNYGEKHMGRIGQTDPHWPPDSTSPSR